MATSDTGEGHAVAIRSCLLEHPTVEDAVVVQERGRLVACVVPSADTAPLLRRACEWEADGVAAAGVSLYEPAPDLLVAQKNRTETDFLYREIFVDEIYFRDGITPAPGGCIIDVGANIGMFSLAAARRSRGVRIIAVEPVEELCRAVRANARIHAVNVEVVNCAAGCTAGTADFTYYPGNTVMSGRFADDVQNREMLRVYLGAGDPGADAAGLSQLVAGRLAPVRLPVAVKSLDTILSEQDVGPVDLLKIDVERAEMDVLAGMSDATWARIRQLVIEVHDIDGRVAAVLDLLRGRGYVANTRFDARLARADCQMVFARRPRLPGTPVEAGEPGEAAAPTFKAPMGPVTYRQLAEELRHHLAQRCPGVAAPDRFEVFARLPSAPALALKSRGGAVGTAVAAAGGAAGDGKGRTPTEQTLVRLCAELFQRPDAEVDSNFFDLGTGSLGVIRLVAQVRDTFGDDLLSPEAVFETSCLGQLASRIDQEKAARAGRAGPAAVGDEESAGSQ